MLDKISSELETKRIDDLYMYKFRTKLCKKKRQCKNPSSCFDAHSKIMKRRVPKLIGSKRGLFNYTPEACLEWRRWKKCRMGDKCTRSHGWLEMIFHPLLYKTKLCKSNHTNGICENHGTYCAKAPTVREIRCLDKIYGKNWKRFNERPVQPSFPKNNPRLKIKNDPRLKIKNDPRLKIYKLNTQSVGLALPPTTCHKIDVNLFAHYLLNKQITQKDPPPTCFEWASSNCELSTDSDIPFEEDCSLGSVKLNTKFSSNDKTLTSYTQLYSSTIPSNEKASPTSDFFTIQQAEGSSTSLTLDSIITLSNPASITQEEWGSSRAIFGSGCGSCSFQSDDENVASFSSPNLKIDAGSFMNRVHQNCSIQRLS